MASIKDSRYADITIRRLRKAQELSEDVFDKVEINRNLYKGYMQTDDRYEWDYSLVDQQVFPLIRNYIARSNPSMTKIRCEARKPEDFEKRQVNQDFINWEIGELPLTQLLTRGFFSNYVGGKAFYKTGWKYEPRVLIQNGQYTFEMRPLINRADLKFVRFNNILIPDRNVPFLADQEYVFELMQMTPGQMLKDNETYGYEYWSKQYINKLRKAGVQSKTLDYEAEFVQDADTMDEIAFRAAKIRTVCMHTKDGEVFYIPLDDPGEIINKDRENPYWHGHYPYLEMCAFPEDDEFYSMSVIDAVGDLQIAGTENLNQLLTNSRAQNDEMWITSSDAATTPDWMFKHRPGGVIRTNSDPTETQQIKTNNSIDAMLRVGQEITTRFERTGGISSLYSSGAPSKSINQTARGAQIIDSNIDTNIQMIMDLFGEQVLAPLGNHFQELNAQYVTEEQSFAVTGKKNVRSLLQIGPDRISANFDIYTYPEAMVKQTPASRQASLQNLASTINREIVPAGVVVDMVPIAENLIDSYPEMENVEDIVVSIDEKAKRDYTMIERGQMPEIKVRDPHMELIQVVSIHFEENQMNYTPEIQALFEQYAQKHIQFLQSEQEIKAMMAPPPMMPLDAGANMDGANPGTIPENMGTGGPQNYDLGNIAGQS